MVEKKRKAGATDSGRPAKKQAQAASNQKLRVDYIAGSAVAKPVIAVTPGVSLPSNLEFQSFAKRDVDGSSKIILHSSTHPTIDFKGVEGDSSADKHLKHYVAVFHPAANTLQITEAKKLNVRSSVRQRQPEVDSDEEESQLKPDTNYSSRASLTQAFGTKKSKKAVQAAIENRLLAKGGDDANNPLSQAILSSMPSPEPSEDLQTTSRESKPLPMPNLITNNINDVYSVSALVQEPSVLERMPIDSWREAAEKKETILSTSRFVAGRVSYLASALAADPSNATIVTKVQLLRYILLLTELYHYLVRLPRFKRVPFVRDWPAKTISGDIPHEVLIALTKSYTSKDAGLGRNQATLLKSTILALALHIPPPSMNAGANVLITDPTDIQLDLGMAPVEIRQLYKELGCKFVSPKQPELDKWGLRKKSRSPHKDGQPAGPAPKFAKLAFPLEFPSVRSGRPAQKKR